VPASEGGRYNGFVNNRIADLVVVLMAAPLERRLKVSARFRRRQRLASAVGMIGLGAYGAFADAKQGARSTTKISCATDGVYD
jgi:hypothetical protein